MLVLAENKESLAVALLDLVINPLQSSAQLYKMKLNDLANRFDEKYGGVFKFKHLEVGKLKHFVHQNEWFKLSSDGGDMYVEQCTPPPKPRPYLDVGLGGGDALTLPGYVTSSSAVADESSSDSELEGYNTCRSKIDTPCPSPSMSRYESPIPFESSFQFSETPWKPASRKGKFARKKLFPVKSETTNLYNFESIDSKRLEVLMDKPPSKTLKFRSEKAYVDDAIFSLDIVSMWNTPDRQTSYIVIGVSANSSPPHEPVGLQEQKKIDAEYQAKFLKGSFSYKPLFRYTEACFNGKRYGVIVIPSSQGYKEEEEGEPCYAETNNSDGMWHQNDIWYCSPDNTLANRKAAPKIIQWFSSSESPHHQRKDPFSEESRHAWELFSEQVGEFNPRKAYSLVISRCSTETKYLNALGKLPWTKVYDFDPESRYSGVLNACEAIMANRITVSTWNEDLEDSLSDTSTDWVFVRGLMSRDDSMVPTKKVREWWTKVGKSLSAHCKQLMQHCETRPLVVIILWYGNFDYITHLSRLLMKIDENVADTKFVLCMPKLPGSDDHKANIHSLCEQFDIEKVVEISLDRLCYEMTQCGCSNQPNLGMKNQLPVSEGTGDSTISERDASWLRQELDVLYKDDVPRDEDSHHTDMGREFFRGGLLGWSEAHLGIFDAKRNIYDELMNQLRGYIDKGTSTIVKIYHEPGAGGTTLSRRILWDLHSKTPCVCLTSTTLKVREVYDRLDFLYQKTHLPLVVLIDGKEICLVNELFQRCQDCHLLILCVQRYTREISTHEHKGNQHWLKGKVDFTEAAQLASAFANGSDATRRRHLQEVVGEVREGESHFVYEFGLIVHAEKYRGIVSYVKGYLNLNSSNLQPWQLAVAYLALVTFYGHSSLPCQFFAGIFGMKQSEVVTTEVLTHNGKQFVLEDSRKLTWKITHHIVAKEILEQVLYPHRSHFGNKDEGSCNRLSMAAKKGLTSFAVQFIKYVSEQAQKRKTYDPNSAVMTNVRTMFIHRDYKETGHDDVGQKRQRISRMLSDVLENTSDYDEDNDLHGCEKLRVMQQLAESFPEDPLFSAHYGRALGIFSNRYDEALTHLDKARSLRTRQMKTFHTDDKKDRTDSTLSTIYHILGIIFHKKIMDLIGGGKLSKSSYKINAKSDLQSILSQVMSLAKVAVGHFKKCRDYCSKGMDESYGYIGEIKLRLHFADFIEVNYRPGGFIGFLEAPNEGSASDVHLFAESCFQEVNNLLQQYEEKCTTTTDELGQCLNWYYALFHDAVTALRYWHKRDDIEGRRSKIAILKIKQAKQGQGRRNYATALDGFQSEDDLKEVVKLYEKNIDEAYSQNIPIDVSLDLRDWMFAIRHRLHPKIYNIETDVLRRVQWCYESLPRSHIALYYMYVLNTILAIHPQTSVRYFAESNQLLEKLKRMRIHLPRLQRLMAYEWVGLHKDRGIHRLVHRSSLGMWDSEQRFWKDHGVTEKLQIFRGTIVSCTNAVHGQIQISTGRTTGKQTLQAVFIPKVSHLYGKMHRNKEVEFFIGFNIEHGIGAYDVRELKRVVCGFCNSTVVASTLVRSECKKCHRVIRAQAQ